MSDEEGRDGKRRGGGRRPGSENGARGGRDGRDAGGRGPFKPRPPKGDGAAGEGRPDGFRPRSHGMRSHAGRDADGAPRTPRSYGRLSHDGGGEGRVRGSGDAAGGKRAPRADDAVQRPRGRPAASGERGERGDASRRSAPEAETMRIAKRLARAGIASRRDAEGMIADGRVRLNGAVLDSPAVDVRAADVIEVDGVPLPPIERTRLWLFHKPAGLVTTNRDPEGRATVFDRLPEDMPRVLTIGRLDINTEGLLLLTNDGGLARTLELPATGWLRRYRVRAHGEVEQEHLDALRQGIAIDGVFYGAIEAVLDRKQGSNVWLTVGLREGKNREVKRILAHLGLDVNRLIRLSFGPFQLGELAEGAVMEVKGRTLRDQLGERLIEESGANFDAPIVTPFSNKPVRGERKPAEPARTPAREEWITSQGGERPRPNRKRADAAHREEQLARLDTSRPTGRFGERSGRDERGERPGKRFGAPPSGRRDARSGDSDMRAPGRFGGKDADRAQDRPERKAPRPAAGAGRRSANVWMAPGARAGGPRKRPMDEGDGAERPRGPRPEGARKESFRGDGPRADDARANGPRSKGPRRDDHRTEGLRKDGPRKDGPRKSGARTDGPRSEGPRKDGPRPGRPRPSGDRPGGGAGRGPGSGPRSGPRGPRPPRD